MYTVYGDPHVHGIWGSACTRYMGIRMYTVYVDPHVHSIYIVGEGVNWSTN